MKSYLNAGIGIISLTVLGKVATFSLDILMANELSTSSYGAIALVLAVSQIVVVFANFGTSATLMRFLPPLLNERDIPGVRNVLKYVLKAALVAGLCVVSLSVLFFYSFPQYSYPDIARFYLLTGVLLGFSMSSSRIIGSYFQSVGRPVFGLAYSENYYPILAFSLLLVIVFMTKLNLLYSVLVLLSASVSILFAGIRHFIVDARARLNVGYGVVDRVDYSELFQLINRFTLNAVIIGMGFIGLRVTDKLMLGWMATTSDVGIYALSDRLSLLITFVVYLLPPVLGPYMSQRFFKEKKKTLDAYLITSRWVCYATIPLLLVLFFYSAELLVTIAGVEYAGGSAVLKLLAVSSFFVAMTGNNGLLLQMSGKEYVDRNNILLALAIDVCLNYFLIPPFHALGAAIATAIALLITTALKTYQVWVFWKIVPFGLGQAKAFLSGAVWIIGFYIFQNFEVSFLLAIVVNTTAYFFALFVFGLQSEDMSVVREIGKRLNITR